MRWTARVTAGLGAAVRAFANPSLARVEVAWALSVTADMAATVALTVYAFRVGGATAVGVAAMIRLLPSAIAAPFLALPGDRYPRERVLTLVEAARGLLVIVGGIAAAFGSPPAAVYVSLGLA